MIWKVQSHIYQTLRPQLQLSKNVNEYLRPTTSTCFLFLLCTNFISFHNEICLSYTWNERTEDMSKYNRSSSAAVSSTRYHSHIMNKISKNANYDGISITYFIWTRLSRTCSSYMVIPCTERLSVWMKNIMFICRTVRYSYMHTQLLSFSLSLLHLVSK